MASARYRDVLTLRFHVQLDIESRGEAKGDADFILLRPEAGQRE
jgi:hypothetical protein